MVRPPSSSGPAAYARWTWCALLVPWRLDRLPDLEGRSTTLFAAVNVLAATALATLLSTWTYLAGKGLVLGLNEMDLGHDDLPPDSATQVALGLLLAGLIWALLLCLLLGACRIVARWLYGRDREAGRRAVRQARILTVWLPAWALLMLLANATLHREVRHPAAAIRARAQLRLDHPDDLRQLGARERFLSIALAFPAFWAAGLRPPAPGVRGGRAVFAARATAVGWLALLFLWRILPWTFIVAWAG